MTDSQNAQRPRWGLFVVAVVALLAFQRAASLLGSAVAVLAGDGGFDPHGAFIYLSIHHLVQMTAALLAMTLCSDLWKTDFMVQRGDVKAGIRYVGVFSAAMVAYLLVSYTVGYMRGSIAPYSYPLNAPNIVGSLAFQLLLSGPSEELLFRALPIALMAQALSARRAIRAAYWNISVETVTAALLFAIGHIIITVEPITVQWNSFQIVYAFMLGIVYGVTYQRTRSVLYPMAMHSISNGLTLVLGYLFAWLFGNY